MTQIEAVISCLVGTQIETGWLTVMILSIALESVGDWCRPFVIGARHHMSCAQLENAVTLADYKSVTRETSKTVLKTTSLRIIFCRVVCQIMAHIIYTPDDNSPYNSDSEHHSVDDLQSAYERRQNVQERQFIAVNVWRKKVIFSA